MQSVTFHSYYVNALDGHQLYRLFGNIEGKGAIRYEWRFDDPNRFSEALRSLGLDLIQSGKIIADIAQKGVTTIGTFELSEGLIDHLNAVGAT